MRTHRLATAAGLLLVVGASNPAAAGPGDAGAGKAVAVNGSAGGAPACDGCHGAAGEGRPALGAPRLAGLDGGYLRRQLAAFSAGTRGNAVMGPIAKMLEGAAAADVAAYYASLAAPNAATPPDADAGERERGGTLAARGDWGKKVPACAACHGHHGLGVGAAFPALAGQGGAYLAAQLRAWKDGTRRDDPMGLMATVAKRLDDEQIAAAAAYYASLPARGPATTTGEIVP